MEALEARLGYMFRDRALLENALMHSSYANENRASCTGVIQDMLRINASAKNKGFGFSRYVICGSPVT